jgi:nucleoside-diphosphate-sugar epimerase
MRESDETTVLVTGATGQIGSELVVHLRGRLGGGKVVAMGHNRDPPDRIAKGGPFERGDVTDPKVLSRIIEEHDIDHIYHLAAVLSAVGEIEPQKAWDLNMRGLQNVLEVARSHELQVFWPSSIAVFGEGYPRDNTPQETVLLPTTMYGVTKVAGELLCNYYHRRFGVDVRSVRFPGIISAETPPGGGTTDYAVAIFYETIRRKRYECFVRADTVLPMLYMPDCLGAAVGIMGAPSSSIRRRDAYNLNAMSFSASELVDEIRRFEPSLEVSFKPDFRQAIADTWPRSLDDSAARHDWGWCPKYDLAAMAEDMMARLTMKQGLGQL